MTLATITGIAQVQGVKASSTHGIDVLFRGA